MNDLDRFTFKYNRRNMRTTRLTLIAMSLLIMGWSERPCDAQFSQPSVVNLYEDDFSSNRVRHDSWTHSVVWVDGAYPPTNPHLVYSRPDAFDSELVFRSFAGIPAKLGYCFPIQPDQVLRAVPLELVIELDLRLLPNNGPRDVGSGYLQYQVSAEGVNWSAPRFVLPGSRGLPLGALADNRFLLFSGANVAIDDLRATILYRPADDLRVPSALWPTIQDAVNAARPGQRVVVADGVYTAAEPINFLGKDIILMSENGPGNCTIDCRGQRIGAIFVQGETRSAVLDGFSIVNGRDEQGGAIFCHGSRPTIANCVFENCQSRSSFATGQGGAIYCAESYPLIQDCQFFNNEANSASKGGQGGAVYVAESAAAEIVRCRFENNRSLEGNSASNSGGAVYIGTSRATAQVLGQSTLRNCVFYNNHAADDGGAIYLKDCSTLIANCTVTGNRADNSGGGLFAYLGSSMSGANLVKNSILWDNSPDNVAKSGSYSSYFEVEYSNVGQAWAGQGILNVDPQFADGDRGDVHLRSFAGRWDASRREWVHDAQSSPCLDRGRVQDALYAERVPHGDLINLGAYGGTPAASRGKGPLVLHVAKWGHDLNSGLLRSEPFATIQGAVDMSLDGDVIMVWPGTYREEVVFGTRAITIQSAADAAIVSPQRGYAFSFHQGEGYDSVLRNMILADCPEGGVFCTSSAPSIKNVTIVNCRIGINAEENSSQTQVANCVFFRNADADLVGCRATYSCSPKPLPGENNIMADPLLMNVQGGDFHLQSNYGTYWPSQGTWVDRIGMSPCIDAGDPGIDPSAEPLANGALLNMGAHGGTGHASMSPSFAEADYNGNGVIDLADYVAFARQWQGR